MSKNQQPDPRQAPNAKGVSRSNDRPTDTKGKGQPGNLHQNMKHSPMQHDR